MADLCACCLRDNEEEKAEFWCCDCRELVCRGCGKVHRRFAIPHEVARLDEVSDFKRGIPTECPLHDNKKLSLFCVGHDKLICHECLIKEHNECNKIMETVEAAKGVKSGSAIMELKKGMEKTKERVYKYRNEHALIQSGVDDNEQKSIKNIENLQKELNKRCEMIRNTMVDQYQQSRKRLNFQAEKLLQIEEKVTQNLENICQIEGGTSELHMFQTVKFLEGTLRKDQKDFDDIVDNKPQNFGVFSDDYMEQVKAFFDNLSKKSQIVEEDRTTAIVGGAMSQVEATQPKVQLVTNDTIPLTKSEYIGTYQLNKNIAFNNDKVLACCFVDEKRIIAILCTNCEKYNKRLQLCSTITTIHLKVINIAEETSKTSETSGLKLDYTRIPILVTMYNETLALVANDRRIAVVDIVDLRICRTINVNGHVEWMQRLDKQIYIVVDAYRKYDICTIDTNGTLSVLYSLQREDLAHADIDDNKVVYASFTDINTIISFDLSTLLFNSSFYESFDVQNGCLVQCLPNNYLLLLEKDSGIMSALNIEKKTRTVLLRDLKNVTNICGNTTRRLLAVMKMNPNEIEIYRAVVRNK